uniref:Uncharacterized protein n=1 Tax=Saimiri boliviensis boliviensis TaxID=39432 RepID=A0A2K6TKR9_SAIBB
MRLRFCISSQEYDLSNVESKTHHVQGMFHLMNWRLTSGGWLDTTPVGDSFAQAILPAQAPE